MLVFRKIFLCQLLCLLLFGVFGSKVIDSVSNFKFGKYISVFKALSDLESEDKNEAEQPFKKLDFFTSTNNQEFGIKTEDLQKRKSSYGFSCQFNHFFKISAPPPDQHV